MRAIRHSAAAALAASLLVACSTSTSQPVANPATRTGDPNGPPFVSASAPSTTATPSDVSRAADPSTASAQPSPGATTTAPAPASTSPAAPPVALPTAFVPLDKVVRDPDLGHEIKVLRLARNLPWPQAQADEASSLELVGVEMTWTPGTTYTATLRTVDVSLGTSSAYPNRPDAVVGPSLQAAGWSVLPAEVPTGQSATGWVVFRVDPKGSPALRLDYTRPASRVTDNGQVFPKTVFSAQLVG